MGEPDKQKRMLRTYFSENDISAELNQRIWTYLQNSHWSMKKRVHERDIPILKTLPETLKAKFREELFFPVLERAPFLRKFSTLSVLGTTAVCFHAVTETSLISTEELFTAGADADKMYFITMGTMEYQHMSLMREEDHELKEKQWVGEPVLWMKWTHFGTLLARTACEILELGAAEFRMIAKTWFGRRAGRRRISPAAGHESQNSRNSQHGRFVRVSPHGSEERRGV